MQEECAVSREGIYRLVAPLTCSDFRLLVTNESRSFGTGAVAFGSSCSSDLDVHPLDALPIDPLGRPEAGRHFPEVLLLLLSAERGCLAVLAHGLVNPLANRGQAPREGLDLLLSRHGFAPFELLELPLDRPEKLLALRSVDARARRVCVVAGRAI